MPRRERIARGVAFRRRIVERNVSAFRPLFLFTACLFVERLFVERLFVERLFVGRLFVERLFDIFFLSPPNGGV